MNHQQLKERALCIAKPAQHFQLIIEESGMESLFIWGDERESIKVQLNQDGHITSYFVSKDSYEVPANEEISQEERRRLADQFLLAHYPNALADFTFYKSGMLEDIEEFRYGQLVMDLPLANAGIVVGLDKAGNLVELMDMGKLPIPEIPTKLVDKDILHENAKAHICMRLVVAKIAEQPRLVYELDDIYPIYQADMLEPTIDQPICNIRYETLPLFASKPNLSLEEVLGLGNMQVVDEKVYNNVKRIVWGENKAGDLYERTVHARVDMHTGQLIGMTWFKERQGNLQLSYEEALQRAIDFLQLVVPELYPYLQLEIDERDSYLTFRFRLMKTQNIKTHYWVTVKINCSTGDVESYHGQHVDMEKLRQVPDMPAISAQQAKEIFLAHLAFRLEWDMGNEIGSSKLMYYGYDKETGKRLGYVDALSGAVITYRD
ncbi:DUF4901 domain-containing protein [Lysinibacillus louembei]|uniref:DUF4901 domain-containing protein n=1 Tax=Lysinibacillus louembei TaxID=1470088 RepID=A0ABZ0S281_9BACI|nr:YcdB/YcdC domain-containing protein [Lysinibacillus louembei]WPK13401.1 DUF4901 domain-containing protein [Lysinibacillus louembei]